MALHIAITAKESFITSLLARHEQIHGLIKQVTIVDSSEANDSNFEELEVIDQFDCDYKKFADVDWNNVDLYLYNDDLANLKHLIGAASKNVLSIDLSGFAATLDQMPVVVPRIDTVQLDEVAEKRMVAIPHPQVSQLLYVLDCLRKNQQMLYVSVTNVFPSSEAIEDGVEVLARQTREFFNFGVKQDERFLAFDVNSLADVDPKRQINFEGQIQRIIPEIDTISVHNIVAPVFYGNAQYVTVGLTTGNTIDQGLVDEWLGEVKDFEGISYKVDGASPRTFVMEQNESLLEMSNVSFAERVK